jgi:hypothetical protein
MTVIVQIVSYQPPEELAIAEPSERLSLEPALRQMGQRPRRVRQPVHRQRLAQTWARTEESQGRERLQRVPQQLPEVCGFVLWQRAPRLQNTQLELQA